MDRDWAIHLTRRVWKIHPGVRSDDQLTLGERSADRLRNGMGSWAFVFAALLFLAVWMAFNRNVGFDPYPFILLNLLSCVAALQGRVIDCCPPGRPNIGRVGAPRLQDEFRSPRDHPQTRGRWRPTSNERRYRGIACRSLTKPPNHRCGSPIRGSQSGPGIPARPVSIFPRCPEVPTAYPDMPSQSLC